MKRKTTIGVILWALVLLCHLAIGQPATPEQNSNSENSEQDISKEELKEFGLSKAKNVIGSIKVAQEYIHQRKFLMAKAELDAAIRKKKKTAVAYRLLGIVHTELQNWEEAISSYETSFKQNPKLSRAAYFECAEVYFKLGKFDEAYDYFNLFDGLYGTAYVNLGNEDAIEKLFGDLLFRRLRSCQEAQKAIASPNTSPAIPIGKNINTIRDEYIPSLHSDGKVMMFTRKKNLSTGGLGSDDENIFITTLEKKKWADPKKIKGNLNTNENEGMAKFSFDGQKVFFAGCNWSDTKGSCDLYTTSLVEDKVEESFNLTGAVNSSNWDSQPSITCDNKAIFFSSNRKGGAGGADIWVSYWRNDQWSPAENLGSTINTKHDEESPYISADGKTLFFASNGRVGLGDGDIYMSKLQETGWSEPINLGYPINTQFKEIGFSVTPDGKRAYLSSNRFGGEGGLDIYEFEMPTDFKPASTVLVSGAVIDDVTEERLAAKIMAVHDGKRYAMETRIDGSFFMCLPQAASYAFIVNHPNYEQYIEAVFIGDKTEQPIINIDIRIKPDIAKVQNLEANLNSPKPEIKKVATKIAEQEGETYFQSIVYFDTGKSKLETDGKAELNNLISHYTRDRGYQLKVVGYADDVGSSSSNNALSEKRAKEVVDYLQTLGVDVLEIEFKIGGEVTKSEGELTEYQRRQSRRVEVTLQKPK